MSSMVTSRTTNLRMRTRRSQSRNTRFITGQFSDEWGRPILVKNPALSFVNQYPLRSGVAVLEQMAARSEEIHLRDENSIEMFRETFGVEVGSFSFSPMVIAGILSGIRSRLIESLDEIEAKHPAFSWDESAEASNDESSLPEKWVGKLKNHPAIAVIVLAGIVLGAVESTTSAISNLMEHSIELRRSLFAADSRPLRQKGTAEVTGDGTFEVLYPQKYISRPTLVISRDMKSPGQFELIEQRVDGFRFKTVGSLTGTSSIGWTAEGEVPEAESS
jgi:hypothetical protein